MSRRSAMMANQGRLPSEYQEVEYLESTGVQYITYRVNLTNYNILKLKIFFSPVYSAVGNGELIYFSPNIGYFGQFNNTYFGCNLYGSPAIQLGLNSELQNDRKYVFEIDNGAIFYEGTYITTRIASPNSLLGYMYYYSQSFYMGKYRIYSYIYNDATYSYNFIPCYRHSDSKPGMYDLVSETFFVNQGTGEFICGPAVY